MPSYFKIRDGRVTYLCSDECKVLQNVLLGLCVHVIFQLLFVVVVFHVSLFFLFGVALTQVFLNKGSKGCVYYNAMDCVMCFNTHCTFLV